MAENESNSVEQVDPYPLAMVVCDAIWTDPTTGKDTLLGLFSLIHAHKFPTTHPLLCVYVSLTDGRGKVPIRLQLVDAEEAREPIFKEKQEIDFMDPRAIVEIQFAGRNLLFPEPGEYRFQLFAGQSPLMERRILVLKLPEAKQ